MNILLTLGRLAKGLELARSLNRAGHRIIIADPFKWHLSKPSRAVKKSYQVTAPNTDAQRYLLDLKEIVEQEHIDLVIPVSEEALYAGRLSQDLNFGARVYGPGFEQMARLHDKLEFARQCHALGLTAPATHPANTQAARDLTQHHDYVVKPAHSCSGIGVHLRASGTLLTPDDQSEQNIVQERLYGRQISTFSIVRDGKVQISGMYEGDVYLGTVSVRFKRVENLPMIERWIEEFVLAEAYTGFISFDFFLCDDNIPYAIECNPRLTSGVHLINSDDLAAMVTGQPSLNPRFKRAKSYQDAHATLTYAVGQITRPLTYLKTLGKVLTTKDVVFDWRDPLPFFLMTPMSWDTIKQGLFQGIPLAEAATGDILWTGHSPHLRSPPREVSLNDAAHEH